MELTLEYIFANGETKVPYVFVIDREEAFETLKDCGYLTRKEMRQAGNIELFNFTKALIEILKDIYKEKALEVFLNETKHWSVEGTHKRELQSYINTEKS
jgi:hypothetical protein